MLVHHRDAAAEGVERRRSSTRRAVEQHLAGIRPINAGQKLDAGALAGAVLAQQREHLAGAQLAARRS